MKDDKITTIILNDAPYGSEKSYNTLRLAMLLAKRGNSLNIFMFGDSVFCAAKGQKTPDGYYNIEKMLSYIIRKGNNVHACGSCMNTKGFERESLIDGVEKSKLETLAGWVEKSSKCLVF